MPSRVQSLRTRTSFLVSALATTIVAAALVSCGKPQAAANTQQGMFSEAAPDGSRCLPGVYSHDPAPAAASHAGMVWVPGGEFSMGSNDPKFSDARPWHRVRLSGYWISKTPITNDQFARFVNATHYITVAERKPSPKDFPGAPPDKLVPGSLVFTPPKHPVELNDDSQWWRFQPGADWRHPEGPNTSIAGKGDYPVVQIAYEDAQAYAKWAGMRLPTEAEFEFAERGGLDCKQFAWGSEFEPHGKPMANTYHGHFPNKSTAKNNDPTTTPVGTYPPNGYGLYDVSGNVWEWNSDWYRSDYYEQVAAAGKVAVDPTGPPDSYDPQEPGVAKHSVRGGSFLCTDQFCSRYEVGGRGQTESSSSANHIGFRVAASP